MPVAGPGRLLDVAPASLVVESGPHPREGHDLVVRVRQDGLAELVEDGGAVEVEPDESGREELHYLAREVLIGEGYLVLGLPHVRGALALQERQVLRHQRAERDLSQHVPVVPERVPDEHVVIPQEDLAVRPLHRDGLAGDDEELGQGPRDALAELVRRGEAHLEPGVLALPPERPLGVAAVDNVEDLAEGGVVGDLVGGAADHDAAPAEFGVAAEVHGDLVQADLVGQVHKLDRIPVPPQLGELEAVLVPAVDPVVGELVGRVRDVVAEGRVTEEDAVVDVLPLRDGVGTVEHGRDHVSGVGVLQGPVGEVVHGHVFRVNPPEALGSEDHFDFDERAVIGDVARQLPHGEEDVAKQFVIVRGGHVQQQLGQRGVRRRPHGSLGAFGRVQYLPPAAQALRARPRLRHAVEVDQGQSHDPVHVLPGHVVKLVDGVGVERDGEVGRVGRPARRGQVGQEAVVLVEEGARDVGAPRLSGGEQSHEPSAVRDGVPQGVVLEDDARVELEPGPVGQLAEDGRVHLFHDVVQLGAQGVGQAVVEDVLAAVT
mmetsp:Transcript_47053/g.100014  ORF Transcript_47053/g.100014 Transcript_47053/m.100014 type:complete len:545 (-) Transcript_47053:504-2138(-)